MFKGYRDLYNIRASQRTLNQGHRRRRKKDTQGKLIFFQILPPTGLRAVLTQTSLNYIIWNSAFDVSCIHSFFTMTSRTGPDKILWKIFKNSFSIEKDFYFTESWKLDFRLKKDFTFELKIWPQYSICLTWNSWKFILGGSGKWCNQGGDAANGAMKLRSFANIHIVFGVGQYFYSLSSSCKFRFKGKK